MKLDVIGDTTRAINEQFGCPYIYRISKLTIFRRMEAMKALFQQLVSPEQKRLSELVADKGGLKVLRDNDKMLLDLEKAASKSSSQSGVDGHREHQAILNDSNLKVNNLRNDILEDPDVAAEKNWTVFSRKFEVQKNQIIDRLTLVVERESDRVIREVQGSAHERIRDRVSFLSAYCIARCITTPYSLQTIHEIWVDMVDSM
jgi:hypothetical protein